MRVLAVGNMYPPHHLGGYELVWQASVRHMRDRGHSVRVLTADFRRTHDQAATEEDADVHRELRWYWHDHEFPRLPLRHRVVLERHNNRVLGRHLDEHAPDVVAWWAMGGMSMSMIENVRRRGLPAVGMVHDDWMLYGPKVDGWHRVVQRLGAARRLAEIVSGVPARVELGAAAEWLFVSATTRSRAHEAVRQLAAARVAHSGIDSALFTPGPEKPWRWRLAVVGRVDPRKGIDIALEALRQLPPEATLSIVGGGDDKHLAALRGMSERRGLAPRVRFLSVPRHNLREVYAQADAFLFPVQWEEPWGLTPLEAMAVGTPVVASGTGGSSEYLRDRENCVIYSPRQDPRALAEAVRDLAGDEGLRARLRANGFETASKHTESRFNESVEQALRDAAGVR